MQYLCQVTTLTYFQQRQTGNIPLYIWLLQWELAFPNFSQTFCTLTAIQSTGMVILFCLRHYLFNEIFIILTVMYQFYYLKYSVYDIDLRHLVPNLIYLYYSSHYLFHPPFGKYFEIIHKTEIVPHILRYSITI